MAELVFKKESYDIVGADINVFNELGFGYQEKYYYRGLKNAFILKGFKVKEQLLTPLTVGGKTIGRYFLDFLLERDSAKIVVELKVANEIYPQFIRQVYGYLKANNLRLGILIIFSKKGVITKRIVN